MATMTWLGPNGASWWMSPFWSTGALPSASDDVVIAVPGQPYVMTLSFFDAFAHSVTVNSAGTTFDIDAALHLGGTLAIKSGKVVLEQHGTIIGGTIVPTGNGQIVFQDGILSGTTFRGTLALTNASTGVRVQNGISLLNAAGNGPGTLNIGNINGFVEFEGGATLDNATVNIGSNTGDRIDVLDTGQVSPNKLLFLGPNLTLRHTGKNAKIASYDDTSLVNAGSISADRAGGFLDIAGNNFANIGVMTVANNDTVLVETLKFSNSGSISAATGGELDFATFATTMQFGDVRNLGGTLALIGEGVLDNTGAIFRIGTGGTTGVLTLEDEATIKGGMVIDGGAGLIAKGGILDGLTYRGLLNLSAAGAHIAIQDSVTFQSAIAREGGLGEGAIALTGKGAYLDFWNDSTIANATISIGGVNIANLGGPAIQGAVVVASQPSRLTLASTTTIHQTGKAATLDAGPVANCLILNYGSIDAGFANGSMKVQGEAFNNQGSISVSLGETVTFVSNQFLNGGEISVASGGSIRFENNLKSGALGTIHDNGGAVILDGITVDNSVAILLTGAGSKIDNLTLEEIPTLSGVQGTTIEGGIVEDTGGGLIVHNGTFDALGVFGAIVVTGGNHELTLKNHVVLAGLDGVAPGMVTVDKFATMSLLGPATLDHATIAVGAGATFGGELFGTDAVTFGANLIVRDAGDGGVSTIWDGDGGGGAMLVNDGLIEATTASGFMNIAGTRLVNHGTLRATNGGVVAVASSTFGNDGIMSADQGGILEIGNNSQGAKTVVAALGNADVASGGKLTLFADLTTSQLSGIANTGGTVVVSGHLNNAGAALLTGPGTKLGHVQVAGDISGGVVVDATGDTSFTGGVLDGVAFAGTMRLSGKNDAVNFLNGVAFSGPSLSGQGGIEQTGIGARVSFLTSTILDHVVYDVGAASGFSWIEVGGPTLTPTILTLGANTFLHQTGADVEIIGSSIGQASGIVNKGDILADFAGGVMSMTQNSGLATFANEGNFTVSNGEVATIGWGLVTNTGRVVIGAGSKMVLQPQFALTNFTGTQLTGGAWEVDANATLELAKNRLILTDNANIVESGAGASIQSYDTNSKQEFALDTTLGIIGKSGALHLLNGHTLINNTAFSNQGLLELGGGMFRTATFANTLGATLTGFGTLGTAAANAGSIEARGGRLDIAVGVTGAGTLQIDSGASLHIHSGTELTNFNGANAGLLLDSPSTFSATLAHTAPTDWLDLAGVHAIAAHVSSSALTVNTLGGTLQFTLASTTATGVTLADDGNGGTRVTFVNARVPGPIAGASVGLDFPALAFIGGAAPPATDGPVSLNSAFAAAGFLPGLDLEVPGPSSGAGGTNTGGSFSGGLGWSLPQDNSTGMPIGFHT